MNIVRISIDRKSGREIRREVIGMKTIDDEQYKEGCVRFLTGLSVEESYKKIKEAMNAKSAYL